MKDKAYITLLSSDNYMYYVVALYDSLMSTNPKYPLYCCVTEDVSADTLKMMDKIGLSYIHVSTTDLEDIIAATTAHNRAPKKYVRALGKLTIFNLDQFSKCVYLDSDLIIKKNIDDLFDKPAFSAVEDCLPVHKRPKKYELGESSFNSGMFVYEPSKEYYNKLLSTIATLPSDVMWHDQAILAYMNQDWMQRPDLQLPYTYNTLVAQQEDVVDEIKRLGLPVDDIKVFHYVTYKNAPYTTPTLLFANVYDYYYEYFEYINELIDKYKLNLEKIHLNNVQCKTDAGKCVDLVVPYVDSADPHWQKMFETYSPHLSKEAIDAPNRFRGNDCLFKYFFRCIEKNMPWVHKIHLIVQDEYQVPLWINREAVHVVYHRDFIPEQYLPTFNSCTIEMFLWNIPELKEEFLYANDDFYVLKETKITDWFGDKVKFNYKFTGGSDTNIYIKHTINAREIVDGVKYDKGFVMDHMFKPYYKSRVKECYNKYKDEINKRITKFRDDKNTNCYLFSYYDYVHGYQTKSPVSHYYYSLSNVAACVNAITKTPYSTIVINDNCLKTPRDSDYTRLIEAFKSKYNYLCKYEFIDESMIPQAYLDKINSIISKVPDLSLIHI